MAGCSHATDDALHPAPAVAIGIFDGNLLRVNQSGQAGQALVMFVSGACATESLGVAGDFLLHAINESGDYVAVPPVAIRDDANPVGFVSLQHGPLAVEGSRIDATVTQGGSLPVLGFVQAVGGSVPWQAWAEQRLEPADCGWSVQSVEVPYHESSVLSDALGEWTLDLPAPGWSHVVWTEAETADHVVRTFRAEFPNGFAVGDVTRYDAGAYTGPPGRYAGSFAVPEGPVSGFVRETGQVGGAPVRAWTFEVQADDLPSSLQKPGYCDGGVCRVFPA
jgi:hypothetical protein